MNPMPASAKSVPNSTTEHSQNSDDILQSTRKFDLVLDLAALEQLQYEASLKMEDDAH